MVNASSPFLSRFARVSVGLVALIASGCAATNRVLFGAQDHVAWEPAAACESKLKAGAITAQQAAICTPYGLLDPDKWVFVGVQQVPNQSRLMTWHKMYGKDPSEYNETFEFLTVASPHLTPEQYLEFFRRKTASDCPSATVEQIRMGEHDVLLELKVPTPGCVGGVHDELDRVFLGSANLFSFVYIVKGTAEMSAAQHAAGIDAVSKPELQFGI